MSSWRQSQIEDMLLCPERYRRSYLTDEEPGTSAAAMQGTAVHQAMAKNLALLKDTGVYENPIAVGEEAQIEFLLLTEYDERSQDPVPWGDGSLGVRSQEVNAMASALWAKMPDILEAWGGPLSIEHTFKDVPCTPTTTLSGTWDLLTDKHNLIDWKTSGSGWKPGQELAKIQPFVYARAVEHVTGTWPNAFLYVVVSRKGKVQLIPRDISRKRLAFLEKTLPELERMKNAGIFPLNPQSALCSPVWCPWYLRGCEAALLKGEVG